MFIACVIDLSGEQHVHCIYIVHVIDLSVESMFIACVIDLSGGKHLYCTWD